MSHLIRRLQDSSVYIEENILTNIYVSKRNQNVPVKFRQIRMYGTLYKYKGYGLDTTNYDGACVPNYFLDTYSNREETNPINKIPKLTMVKALDILVCKICMKVAQ